MSNACGSRFVALTGDGTGDKKQKKEKKFKDNKQKKVDFDEEVEVVSLECGNHADPRRKQKKEKSKDKSAKDKKQKKDKANDGDCAEKGDDNAEEKKENTERQRKDALCFHSIIVTSLYRHFGIYSAEDNSEAAAWLGLDFDVAGLASGSEDDCLDPALSKYWPRMLKHLAKAIEDNVLPPRCLAELWDKGHLLFEKRLRCAHTKRLQIAIEARFEDDQEFRDAADSRTATRRTAALQLPPLDVAEPLLFDCPLPLFGRAPVLSGVVAPRTVLHDESRRCFAFHWPRLLVDVAQRFSEGLRTAAPWQQLLKKDGTVKRSTCWYTCGGCRCDYTYGGETVGAAAEGNGRFQSLMEEITATMLKAARPDWPDEKLPNSANLNLYADGFQTVGWHADDESLFAGKTDDCLIVSLSLGVERQFWLAPRGESASGTLRADTRSVAAMTLCEGDVMTMEGLCQKHFLHCVPSARATGMSRSGRRINITWRRIVKHKRSCPLYAAR